MTTTFSIAGAGVTTIAGAVAAGELTPDEVIESVLERIDATEPKIQAWSQLDKAVARAEAATLTAEQKAGKLRGPLHGVPIAIKEWFDVEGFPTLLKGAGAPPEPADATVVARLRAAGAIIVGKTHTPIGNQTPPTRNPYNLEHTAGGSSSGSGAVVGARVVPMALGEQTGGSNLRPAAYCGVGAVMPTYGVLSRRGLWAGTWSKDHPGFMGLTMADLAIVLNATAGFDPKDPTTSHAPPPPADLKMAEYGTPKIGVVRNFFPELTEPEMQDAIERSARQFAAAGATVVDVMLPAEYGLAWTASGLVGAEGAALHAEQRAAERVTLAALSATGVAGNRIGVGRGAELVPATYYVQARRARTWLTRLLEAQLAEQGIDALLMAVAPGAAPKGLASTGDATLLSPWTFLGFPATTVNAGLSKAGLPLGLQLVAAPMEDWSLMRASAWCEKTLGLLGAPSL